uniref:Tumor necrosis factor receptor superfamily member 6B-like n=1 Tax=Labrus bergylta TaxID=56723 RepID=A0A3Q3GAM0_9LABR|nr:tumor necrosis factor receptor superfamily member 6B-like [Labrus bergylta]
MHAISMLILPVLLLFSAVPRSVSDPTYERVDPLTRESLLCNMCPPGTHMSAHCNATTQTVCKPCSNEHFTEMWNYMPKCLYCNTFCQGNMEVEKECSAVNDRVCRCEEGYYKRYDFCVRHTECGPGHGVHTKGTIHKNTICERCPEGTFSNSSSALEPCVNHQTCASGEIVLTSGTMHHDTVCGTCKDLERGGETLRTVFLGLLKDMHKMPVAKMRKRALRSAKERRPRNLCPLMYLMRTWLEEATQEQLIQLREMLKALQPLTLSEKLEKTLNELKQQSPNCQLTF